jgi:hypothetical protein
MAHHTNWFNVAEPETGAALVKSSRSTDFAVVLMDRPLVVYGVA